MENPIIQPQGRQPRSSHLTNGTEAMTQTLHSYKCSKCKDEGYILWQDKDGHSFYKECDCGIKKKRILQERLKFAEIPEMYKGCGWKGLRSSVYLNGESKKVFVQAGKSIRGWYDALLKMQEVGMGLYLHSESKGSGKTLAACVLANEIMENYGKVVKFTTALKILSEIKVTWDGSGEDEKKLIDDLSRVEILIIDDFGATSNKDWINDRFYEIINNRYTSRKITIFTSNYCISRLNYDERITNRILERSLEIPFPEESVREHIAETMKQQMIAGIMGGEK